jgi:hypothetical protein
MGYFMPPSQNPVLDTLATAELVAQDIRDALAQLSDHVTNHEDDLTKARAWTNNLMALRALLLAELARKQKVAYPVAK